MPRKPKILKQFELVQQLHEQSESSHIAEKILLSPLSLCAYDMPGFECPRHIELICKKVLDLLFDRIPNKKILAVSVPPRHGKSTFLCVYLPAWFIMMYPDKSVILLSYSNVFAEEHGRKVKELINKYGTYAGIKLSGDARSASHFRIKDYGGGMTSVSIYGSYTGRGAHLLLVDDAVKEIMDILSPTKRERMYETFRACALTRLEPGGKVIIIMTRWSQDDIIGQLLRDDVLAEYVEYVRIPAIAEENDILGRQVGEPLWPSRYDKKTLSEIADSMGGFDSPWFLALYQQNPPSKLSSGNLSLLSPSVIQARMITSQEYRHDFSIRYWDLAGEAGKDFTASIKLACDMKRSICVIEDITVFRANSIEEVQRHIVDTINNNDAPHITTQVIEEVSGTGAHVVYLFQNMFAGKYNVVGDKGVVQSKIERLNYVCAIMEANKLFVNKRCSEDQYAWSEFIRECMAISTGVTPVHDDVLTR
jgi:hypothetical protein